MQSSPTIPTSLPLACAYPLPPSPPSALVPKFYTPSMTDSRIRPHRSFYSSVCKTFPHPLHLAFHTMHRPLSPVSRPDQRDARLPCRPARVAGRKWSAKRDGYFVLVVAWEIEPLLFQFGGLWKRPGRAAVIFRPAAERVQLAFLRHPAHAVHAVAAGREADGGRHDSQQRVSDVRMAAHARSRDDPRGGSACSTLRAQAGHTVAGGAGCR